MSAALLCGAYFWCAFFLCTRGVRVRPWGVWKPSGELRRARGVRVGLVVRFPSLARENRVGRRETRTAWGRRVGIGSSVRVSRERWSRRSTRSAAAATHCRPGRQTMGVLATFRQWKFERASGSGNLKGLPYRSGVGAASSWLRIERVPARSQSFTAPLARTVPRSATVLAQGLPGACNMRLRRLPSILTSIYCSTDTICYNRVPGMGWSEVAIEANGLSGNTLNVAVSLHKSCFPDIQCVEINVK
jgi:hypothetical protein